MPIEPINILVQGCLSASKTSPSPACVLSSLPNWGWHSSRAGLPGRLSHGGHAAEQDPGISKPTPTLRFPSTRGTSVTQELKTKTPGFESQLYPYEFWHLSQIVWLSWASVSSSTKWEILISTTHDCCRNPMRYANVSSDITFIVILYSH